jgi:hypothetical protein
VGITLFGPVYADVQVYADAGFGRYKIQGLTMASLSRLPVRFPTGAKYVLESRGQFVRRYIELPNGRRVQLARRKALFCACAAVQQINTVPDETAAVIDAPSLGKHVAA